MSFHVLLYSGSIGTGSTFTEIAAITDGVFAIANNHFVHGSDVMLIAAYAGGTSLNSVRLSTPSLRQIAQPLLRPVSSTREPGNDPNLAELLTSAPAERRGDS